jgi:hypothetical protein
MIATHHSTHRSPKKYDPNMEITKNKNSITRTAKLLIGRAKKKGGKSHIADSQTSLRI